MAANEEGARNVAKDVPEKDYDLIIIGAGIAGLAAALFAANRGADTVQIGSVSELNFSSGLIDLMGVHPVDKGRAWDNPWAAIDSLIQEEPRHPYARLDRKTMETAMGAFFSALEEAGLPCRYEQEKNLPVITHLGTIKKTYGVPVSMYEGSKAMMQGRRGLIVDFQNLRGFSARMIVENLAGQWPGLKYRRIVIPGFKGELYNESLAWSLEASPNLKSLAENIRPHLGDAEVVGLPAVLGIRHTLDILGSLEAMLGRKVFEIPTMLPSITGMRLRESFVTQLRQIGVTGLYHNKVTAAHVLKNGRMKVRVSGRDPELELTGRAVILATGRFFGRGLHADRRRIRETVFDIPVYQTPGRELWYEKEYFSPGGHKINRAGVETDDRFRPVGVDGKPVFENLFAAGSILAHQDWKRQKCGCGLAVTTAYAAVKAALDFAGRS